MQQLAGERHTAQWLNARDTVLLLYMITVELLFCRALLWLMNQHISPLALLLHAVR